MKEVRVYDTQWSAVRGAQSVPNSCAASMIESHSWQGVTGPKCLFWKGQGQFVLGEGVISKRTLPLWDHFKGASRSGVIEATAFMKTDEFQTRCKGDHMFSSAQLDSRDKWYSTKPASFRFGG